MKLRVSDHTSERIKTDNSPNESSLMGCCPLEEVIVKVVGLDVMSTEWL